MITKKTIIPIILIFTDFIIVLVSYGLAYLIRDRINGVTLIGFGEFFLFSILVAGVYVLVFIYMGLYSVRLKKDLLDQLFAIVIGSVAATGIMGAGIYFGKNFDYSRLIIAIGLIISIIFIWVMRFCLRRIERSFFRKGKLTTKVLIIGSGEILKITLKGYLAEWSLGYEVIGIILTKPTDIEFPRLLGLIEEIDYKSHLNSGSVDQVIWAEDFLFDKTQQVIVLCEENGVVFKYVPNLYGSLSTNFVSEDIAGFPVIEARSTNFDNWTNILKRLLDIFLSIFGLMILLPLFIVVAIAIRVDSSGPVFFIHKRVGRYGKEFNLFKFRSMAMIVRDGQLLHSNANVEVEKIKEQQSNYKLKDDPRITPVGNFIRKTSIDELPQLINVLKGEMSLVGPRAYLRKELDSQLEKFPQTRPLVRRLLTVKPGITGLWQISGRSNVDFAERVAMDAHYATEANLWLDLKMIILTIPAVLKGSGAM